MRRRRASRPIRLAQRVSRTSPNRDQRRTSTALPALLALAAGVIAVLFAGVHADSGQRDRLDATAKQATSLAETVLDDCATGRSSGRSCQTAAEVKATPIPGPTGAQGPAGRDGVDGKDGAPGEGPPCLSEPLRCQGPAGTNGVDGRDGVDGKEGPQGPAGPPGPPCPTGSTQQTITYGDGRTGVGCVLDEQPVPPSAEPSMPAPTPEPTTEPPAPGP